MLMKIKNPLVKGDVQMIISRKCAPFLNLVDEIFSNYKINTY